MDKRKEFETSPRFKGMDFTRSVTHPEYYESPYANGAWDGWQASRAAMVIDLSPCKPILERGCYASPHKILEIAEDAIHAAGANTK